MKYLIYILGMIALCGCQKKQFESIRHTEISRDTVTEKSFVATVDSNSYAEYKEVIDTTISIPADTHLFSLPLSFLWPAWDSAGREVERGYFQKKNGITLKVKSKDGKVDIEATTDEKTFTVPKIERHYKTQQSSTATKAATDKKEVSQLQQNTETLQKYAATFWGKYWGWIVAIVIVVALLIIKRFKILG